MPGSCSLLCPYLFHRPGLWGGRPDAGRWVLTTPHATKWAQAAASAARRPGTVLSPDPVSGLPAGAGQTPMWRMI